MIRKIDLLDCTLRDGGYVNDWDFGHSVITGTYKRLDASGIEMIEVGFLDERRPFDINRTIMPDTDSINRIYQDVQKKNATPVAMIDFGTCSLEHIKDCNTTFIDGIRVIFKKEKIDEALPFCEAIKEKGYKLFIQAISITSYSDIEMLQYVERINKIKPYAFSIVDTYGLLSKDKLTKYFYLIDNNLDPDIRIGYHAHNNFQLAYSNSINFLELQSKRGIVVDATVYGMGKSAGNCNIELLAMYMNERLDKGYDMNQIMEIIDTDLMAIYQQKYWGYKYNFYISALHDCHPNYVQYLLDKKTLAISDINAVLNSIADKKKLLYDQEYIEKLYVDYQNDFIDDTETYKRLTNIFRDNKVLVIGPGKSIERDRKQIQGYIEEEFPIVISTNFTTDMYPINYIFISNTKRYIKLADMSEKINMNSEVIASSNITELDYKIDYKVNYESLLDWESGVEDNTLILLLKLLKKCSVGRVLLAGFDGYDVNGENYYNREYNFVGNEYSYGTKNQLMTVRLKQLSEEIDIKFLTDSIYNWGKKNDK